MSKGLSKANHNKPTIGLAAGKESTFKVLGRGKVKFQADVNSTNRTITLDDVLYTPGLRSNLILVSKLVEKGVKVSFDNHEAFVKLADNTTIMMAKRSGRLYTVKTKCKPPMVLTTQTKHQAVTFDTWHQRLEHMVADTIHEMANKNLVDGLNITGELTMRGRCEDCIFGKHSTHPFNNSGYRETKVLERIHIDMWGPLPIQSAGGTFYFMLLMDGHLSYRTVAFLTSKSADTTLNVFKAYHTETERQTGKKLKHLRLDMGKEWHNKAWEQYRKDHGLVFEFTTPYTHQQNGTIERSIRTILNGARTALAELGLPMKYWADAIQVTIYVRNLVTSSQ